MQQKLRVTDFTHVIEAFDAGEISFHSGWIFHRAGANTTSQMRKVMTIIYMDRDMRLKSPDNQNQINDWNTWCPGATIGEVINSRLNPVLFEYWKFSKKRKNIVTALAAYARPYPSLKQIDSFG